MGPSPVTLDSSTWDVICDALETSDLTQAMICNNSSMLLTQWHVACNTSQIVCLQWGVTQINDSDMFLSTSTTPKSSGEWDLATNDLRMYFQIVNFVFICELIDLFGTGTNVVNIICFVKQGLRDPVNLSFLALSISDLLSLITLVWHNISVNPLLYSIDNIPFDPEQTVYLTAGIPHLAFTRVTGWITAFITLERCLCITHPLRVKNLFTPKRVTTIMCCIFVVIVTINTAPVYYITPFGYVDHPFIINRTWIGLLFTDYRRPIEKYLFGITGIFLPMSAFCLVVVSTIILVIKLKSKTKWRQKSTTPGKADSLSNRDRNISRMVVMISSIFIACYIPVCVISFGMIIEPKLSIDSTFGNMFTIIFSFAYILESINASFNIFVYYKVSSRYRTVFRQTFCRDKQQRVMSVSKTTTSVVLEKHVI